MNVRLRVDLLTKVWNYANAGWPGGGVTPQEFYGVAITAQIEPVYLYTLEKFLTATLPWHTTTTDAETQLIHYEFPPGEECVRHMLYEVLLKNSSTFLRFILNTYCVFDEDYTLNSHDMWSFLLQWARKYEIPTEYLPINSMSGVTRHMEELGYTKAKTGDGSVFWGMKLAE